MKHMKAVMKRRKYMCGLGCRHIASATNTRHAPLSLNQLRQLRPRRRDQDQYAASTLSTTTSSLQSGALECGKEAVVFGLGLLGVVANVLLRERLGAAVEDEEEVDLGRLLRVHHHDASETVTVKMAVTVTSGR